MKLHYYPETDSLYIEPKAGPGPRLGESAPGESPINVYCHCLPCFVILPLLSRSARAGTR